MNTHCVRLGTVLSTREIQMNETRQTSHLSTFKSPNFLLTLVCRVLPGGWALRWGLRIRQLHCGVSFTSQVRLRSEKLGALPATSGTVGAQGNVGPKPTGLQSLVSFYYHILPQLSLPKSRNVIPRLCSRPAPSPVRPCSGNGIPFQSGEHRSCRSNKQL